MTLLQQSMFYNEVKLCRVESSTHQTQLLPDVHIDDIQKEEFRAVIIATENKLLLQFVRDRWH